MVFQDTLINLTFTINAGSRKPSNENLIAKILRETLPCFFLCACRVLKTHVSRKEKGKKDYIQTPNLLHTHSHRHATRAGLTIQIIKSEHGSFQSSFSDPAIHFAHTIDAILIGTSFSVIPPKLSTNRPLQVSHSSAGYLQAWVARGGGSCPF